MPYQDSTAIDAYEAATTVGEKAGIDYPRFIAEATNLPRDYVAAQLAAAEARIARGEA